MAGMTVGPPWASRRNRFAEALAAGRPATAMWLTSFWPAVPQIVGAAGLDAALIDLQHTSQAVVDAEAMIVACEAAGVTPLVRPASIDAATVGRILDAGAQGIVFPEVEDAAAARHAVACTRYRPAGVRGWGGAHTRHAGWAGGYAADALGTDAPGVYSATYVEKAAADVLVVVLVETVQGVENVAEIVAVEGVDAAIFGWGDFAVEVGFDTARCREAAAAVSAACRRAGVACALSPGEEPRPGAFAIAGVDSLHMSAALAAAVAAAGS